MLECRVDSSEAFVIVGEIVAELANGVLYRREVATEPFGVRSIIGCGRRGNHVASKHFVFARKDGRVQAGNGSAGIVQIGVHLDEILGRDGVEPRIQRRLGNPYS
ncbi:hypothetical protein DIE23_16415 [Burkholderia sp. Bp9143]|nr:hypothetical protein DIE23_16415 [Burkholderia sp. Bp9143]